MTTATSKFDSLIQRLVPASMRAMSDEEFEKERGKLLAVTPIPGIWLFGKTQTGKTSIVKLLTGAESARIGSGFRPETKTTFEYDFPSPDNLLVRFLDTRGLGESSYDPNNDIRALSEQTHLMIVTARITDHALEPILVPLREIRAANPQRPVLLVLTCLHEAYPGEQDPKKYPFTNDEIPAGIPDSLRRHIAEHKATFEGLYDRMVAIDFTPPEDGFDEPQYGADHFKETLLSMLPSAYRETIRRLDSLVTPLKDLHDRRAMPFIYSYSSIAASAAAVPVPWIDIPVVIGVQVRLVRKLGELYGQSLAAEQILSMAGVVGTRVLIRLGLRELLKAIPFLGVAANAAMAFASTFGLGRASAWYFGRSLAGHIPTSQEFQSVLKEQMAQAEQFWKQHRPAENNT